MAQDEGDDKTALQRVPRAIHLIGILGALALVVTLVLTIHFQWMTSRGGACPNATGTPKGTEFAIVDVQPMDLQLGKTLCVTVENVVSKTDIDEAARALQTAQDLQKVAAQELKLARDNVGAGTAVNLLALQAQITAKAAQLSEAQADVKARRDEKAALGRDRNFVLLVNGAKSPLTAWAKGRAEQQALSFSLDQSADAATDIGRFWRKAMAVPIKDGKIDANLALAEGEGAPTPFTVKSSEVRKIVLYGRWVRVLALFSLFAVLTWLVALAAKTSLLRSGNSHKDAFSLGRVQMMWWSVLVAAGFLYILIVTGQCFNVMNTATFALLGISGVAAGAAQAVDKIDPNTRAPRTRKTANLISDLAKDDTGEVQLHRLQMMLWTLVLGGIFIWQTLTRLELADFDANLLALAGVVNGVYVGLKTQEP